ncbi:MULTISPECIES: creatininase [unclassified Mycolicibacterium]|uniref:creatininase n=1 Tax=unclassified Mycolicibacterium TaxID=2636767 RepID=UPI002EDA63D0
MTTRTVLIEDMTAPEIGSRAARSVLFVPLGSIEQHGPHMPIDTDSIIASAICCAVADRIEGLVGPKFNYGCRSLPISGGGELFPGTISLTGETFTCVVSDLISTYVDHGHPRIVLINGHYENTMFAIEGAKRALRNVPQARILLIDWWTILDPQTLSELFDGNFPGWEAEHAGVIETSMLMHIAPERVLADRIENRTGSIPPPLFTVLPEREGLVDPSGVLRTAWGANPDLGASMFDKVVEIITQIVNGEFPNASAAISEEPR